MGMPLFLFNSYDYCNDKLILQIRVCKDEEHKRILNFCGFATFTFPGSYR